MTRTNNMQQVELEYGRDLARELYEYSLTELEDLPDDERQQLRAQYPKLSRAQFEDVFRQVVAAKRQARAQVGWQSVPHDLAAIVLVVVVALADLQTGLAAGIGVLVLLEGLSMTVFDPDLYRPLSLLVWLTYPAYALLAYVLYKRDYRILVIGSVVLFAWAGLFLLGALARIPLQLLWKERAKQRQSKET